MRDRQKDWDPGKYIMSQQPTSSVLVEGFHGESRVKGIRLFKGKELLFAKSCPTLLQPHELEPARLVFP